MNEPIQILPIPIKKFENAYFDKVVKKFIQKEYGKDALSKYSNAIDNIQKVRKSFTSISTSDDYQKYLDYAVEIEYVGMHIPINTRRVKMSFTCYDAFSRRKMTKTNTFFEQANALFVAGALLSQTACKEPRSTPESAMKAAKLFKEAAGVFSYLKEKVIPKIEGKTTVDLKGETLGVIVDIMLANAQQCVLEKALQSGMKKALLSMLAMELSDMWRNIHPIMKSSTVKECFKSNWVNMATFKRDLYSIYAEYLIALDLYANTEVGKACARLRKCKKLMAACGKYKIDSQMKKDYAEFVKIFNAKNNEIENDNTKVYFEVVPPYSELEELKKKRIVKIQNFDFKKLVNKPDPFKSLFPIHVMEAVQKYAQLLNQKLAGAIRSTQLHREHIKNNLAKMGLPGSVMAEDSSMRGFPKEVHAKIAQINKGGGVRKLVNYRKTLKEMAQNVTDQSQAVIKRLNKEEMEDLAERRKYGIRWNRLPSGQLNGAFKKQLSGVIAKVNQAAQADGLIDQKVKQFNPYFKKFDLQPAQLDVTLPKTSGNDQSPSAKTAATLRGLLKQLDALFAQEMAIENGVKKTQKEEDVQSKFFNATNVDNEINVQLAKFDVELKKLGGISAQEDKLFQTINQQNQYYIQSKKSGGQSERAKHIQTMYFTMNKYDEILGNISQGLNFYCSMQDFVKKLEKSVSDFVYTRGIEKNDLVTNLARQLTYQPPKQQHYQQQYQPQQFNPYGQQYQQQPQQQQQQQYYNPYGQNQQQQQNPYGYNPYGK